MKTTDCSLHNLYLFIEREILSDGKDKDVDWMLSLLPGDLLGMSRLLRRATYRNKLASYFENI